ncbi:MAG: recombinase family protein [Alphaproteobacteria bacterium]|nr:recombinase family protein [Alphaproteobacteria bacterium]
MRVALYARVSTTRQAENELSIPDQLRQMRDWCKRNGHIVAAEYVEAGATATDDKRPEFQEMVAAAVEKPAPFEAIIVHSYSRFFRDLAQAVFYERKLNRVGVKLYSITQQTNDDPSGELFRHLVMMFDEYQSKENAKHTLRGMNENARQGYFNGAKAPFGFRTIDAGRTGTHGRLKKKLDIDPAEAEIVREIFTLYVSGKDAPRIGMKEIAKNLNSRGLLMRGKEWRVQKVFEVLSSLTYMGLHVFNKTDSKTHRTKPESEWVKVPVPAIIDLVTFEQATKLRGAFSPKRCIPRRETSPHLLTGLLKCDCCGSGMTITTGKSGQYAYYKCTNRMSKGNASCPSRNIPTDKLEGLVLDAFRQKICTADYLKGLLNDLRAEVAKGGGTDKGRIKKLETELKTVEQAQNRLLEAIERGALDFDMVGDRAHQNKARKENLLLEIASLKRKQQMPLAVISPQKIDAFTRVIRDRLTVPSVFSRAYLKAAVSEIRIKDQEMTIRGSRSSMVSLISNGGNINTGEVPSFISQWRPLIDAVRTSCRQEVLNLHKILPPTLG